MEKHFWGEAVNTAVYLRNRSIASGLDGKTPLEIWSGKKPDISHLRIFGSTAMVHIPKQRRLKWDKKSKKMILVGFSDTTKGYRLHDPDKRDVIVSRDVIIIEENSEKREVVICLDRESSDSVGEESKSGDNLEEDFDSAESESVGDESSSETSDDEYLCAETEQIDGNTVVRRSSRVPKPKSMDDFVSYLCVTDFDDPRCVKEALMRADADHWKVAMKEELDSFEENMTWELQELPEGARLVDCKWVFKKKVSSENNVTYRARLVARGFTQEPGVDYEETFSPVVRHSTLRLLIALSLKLNLDITHLDVKTAFLNGYLKEQVFMKIPEGYDVSGSSKNMVLKLNRAIYGLKQASRAWNERVNTVLLELGYKKSDLEPCLYTKQNSDKSLTIVALYVDDFFVFSSSDKETSFLKKELGLKFKIKDLGRAKQILGMEILIDKESQTISLSQEKYYQKEMEV